MQVENTGSTRMCNGRSVSPTSHSTDDLVRNLDPFRSWRPEMSAKAIVVPTGFANAGLIGLGRIAYLAPGVLKRLVYKREVPAVTLLKLTDVAALPWHEQPERVFD